MSEACHQCKFWFKGLMGTSRGSCRRHAPSPNRRHDNDAGIWPQTLDDDWCGDYVNRYAAVDHTDGTVAADKPTM